MKCKLCDKEITTRGYCTSHYQKALRKGELEIIKPRINKGATCSVENCNNDAYVKLLCMKHYQRLLDNGKVKKELDKSQWTSENIAWLAGLLEGEGCFTIYKQKNFQHKTYVLVQIHMTDFDVLDKILRIVREGKIRGPYRENRPNHKPYKCWTIRGFPALALLKAILPHMCSRRTIKIKKCIDVLENNMKTNKSPYV